MCTEGYLQLSSVTPELASGSLRCEKLLQGSPPRQRLRKQRVQAKTEQQANIDKPEDEVDIEVGQNLCPVNTVHCQHSTRRVLKHVKLCRTQSQRWQGSKQSKTD